MNALNAVRARWSTRSVRFQLTALVALVGVLLIVLNAALLSAFLNQYVMDREGAALGQDAAALSRCSSNGVAVGVIENRPVDARLVQAVLGSTQARHAIVVKSTGVVRYATSMPRNLRATLLSRLRQDLALGQLTAGGTPPWHLVSNEIVVESSVTCRAAPRATTLLTGTRAQGGLILAEDQQVAESAWHHLLTLVLVAGLVTAAAAGLTGLVAGDAITRPIRAVTRAARAIASGNFRRRVSAEGAAEITEMAVAFNRMVDEVERRRSIERDLLANISHELASPLGLIRGYAEALSDGVIASESERGAALRSVRLETVRLQRLTADLLDLALLETGQVSLHVEQVPVGELLRGLRERLAPRFAAAGVTSTVEAPDALPPIWTDGHRLEQVLVNLLDNAVRHSLPGGSISISADQEPGGVIICVRDCGVGIPPEQLSRIWERFYRVEKGRDRREQGAGMGLGLAIVRSTVTVLQGTIDVASTPDVGTTFSIRLPFQLDGASIQQG